MHMISVELTRPRLPQGNSTGIARSVHVEASKIRGMLEWLVERYCRLKAYCQVSVN